MGTTLGSREIEHLATTCETRADVKGPEGKLWSRVAATLRAQLTEIEVLTVELNRIREEKREVEGKLFRVGQIPMTDVEKDLPFAAPEVQLVEFQKRLRGETRTF